MSDTRRDAMRLPMLTIDAKLAEIKRLYFKTTRQTIQQDLAKALDLLKSMASEEERERVAVYMDGLAQMRSDWARSDRAGGQRAKGTKAKSPVPGSGGKGQTTKRRG